MHKCNEAGHPKLQSLLGILSQFFDDDDVKRLKSKCIVFTNTRANAIDITEEVTKAGIAKAGVFLGHGGMSEKDQTQIVQNLKNGVNDLIVATCVAEEGLDIGEIDLIVCFDSGLSPVRLVQRMGRTGRKRKGRVVLLLNQSEYKTYIQSKSKHKTILKELRNAS